MSLAFVANKSAQLFLKNYVDSHNEDFYIGLKYIKDHRLIWDCNSSQIPDLDWFSPLNLSTYENCAYLSNEKIKFDVCNKPRNFICSNTNHSDMPITDTSGRCPNGFFRFQNKCYKMNLKCKDPVKNWTEAQKACKTLSPRARLMTPDSMMEGEFLTALMTKSPQALWTGFVKFDINNELSVWINEDIQQLATYPINFNEGEPNYGVNERCLMSYHRLFDIGRINDENCSKSMNYLCEAPLEKENSTVSQHDDPNPLFYRGRCKEHYYEFNETCYYVDNQTKSFQSANEMCPSNLLNVYTYIDVAFIRSLMSFTNVSTVWFTSTEKVGGVSRFNQGARVLISEMEIRPNFSIKTPPCNVISSMKKGLQNDKLCSEKHSSICYYFLPDHETNTDHLHCPLNWIKVGKKCFKLALEMFDFTQSRDQCKIYNGKLATLKNMKEVQAIGSHLSADSWIGLTGQSLFNNSWIDGTQLDYCLFRHTKNVYQESMEVLKQQCFILRPKKSEWVLRSCNQSNPFICEQAAQEKICPEHIPINIDGNCYGPFNIIKTWDDAERHCMLMGGNNCHLASFHSLDQQSTFFSQINDTKPYWFGLRMYESGQQWIDNTPINYQLDIRQYRRYFSRDLSCFSSSKASAKISYSWTRKNCALKLPFICKISNNTKTFLPIPIPDIKPYYYCPAGFTKHDLSCFKVFRENVTWSEANFKCRMLFNTSIARLARFQSLQELDSVISSLRSPQSEKIWIGLLHERETHQFVWVDEKPFNIMHPIANYDHNVSQPYVAMEISGNPYQNGQWWKYSGQENFPYICRVDPHEKFIPSQDNHEVEPFTSRKSSRCPIYESDSKNFEYNDHCYSYIPMKRAFKEANISCQSHLLTISDTFEEFFIRSYLKANQDIVFPIWLGLKVTPPNFVMNWTTTGKADVFYTHWKELKNYGTNIIPSSPQDISHGCLTLHSNYFHAQESGMAFFDCSSRFPFICKTPISLHKDPPKNACAISKNDTAYLLDVTHTRNNEPCVRWDLVIQKDPYSYHAQTSLYSSLPFNSDGYLSYSLQRCSEFKNESGFYNYSCYVLKESKYDLQACEMVSCHSKDYLHGEVLNSGHHFIIIISLLLIVVALGYFLYIYRGSFLSNYRVREFLANVLGRYQPDCLRYPNSRPQPGPVGGTGFVNPIYTPLETRY